MQKVKIDGKHTVILTNFTFSLFVPYLETQGYVVEIIEKTEEV